MIRSVLEGCYVASGVAGAISMILLAAVVLAQILGRLIEFQIRGTDDFTAWLMAAGACFSLAYTFRHGTHIRVGLLLERLDGVRRRWLEIVCLAIAAATTGMFTYAAFDLVYNSWRFHEIAPGLVRIPMWIPQTSMALGALVLMIALLDDLVMLVLGRRASYQKVNSASAVERAGEEL